MSDWLLFFLILVFVRFSRQFKIEIQPCHTQYGSKGYCRLLEDCVGATETLSTSGCLNNLACCPIRSVSKKKCYEYGDAVSGGGAGALMLMGIPQPEGKDDECAIHALPLIVGGEKANLKEFPHMAAIGFGVDVRESRWMCGGTLISDKFILTAAHCLTNSFHGRPRFIKLGVVNVLNDYNENLQIREIERVIIHPRFAARDNLNDVALLKLDKQVQFTPFVRPACLDYGGIILESSALATGWGKTRHEDEREVPDLLKVQLDIIDRKSCDKTYKPKGLRDSVICAGMIAGGKDTCQGDSGGPLQTVREEPYCMYSLVGVTSYGRVCGYSWSPAIYSRVFTYVPWIESIVWPKEN